jgi:hypothetical protein
MAKKKHISAVISLKDNFSAGLRGVRREQNSFRKEVAQTRKAMDALNKKKMNVRLNATQANKAFNALKKNTKYIEAKKKLVQVVVAKDMAMAKLKKIQSTMKSLGNAVAKPIVMAKDKATSMIKGISSKLGALAKGIAIPLTIATAGAGAAIKGGMELEQQQISMRHFMGVGNAGKSDKELDAMSAQYLKDLRENANVTPFETGEVISAGTRALQIAGGNTKEAMNMVKLAEDMAALNPGKTVGDAMEAIADMNIGEMARLTEFGVKASSKDDPKEVQKQLETMYAGGAGKLADSGSGLLSTITGKLKSNMADIGQSMLEPLKPVMSNVIEFINQVTPKMLEFGTKIGEGLGQGITWITENMPTIQPIFSNIFGAIQTVVTTVTPIIGQALVALGPVFTGLLSVAGVAMKGISGVVQAVAPIVSSLINALKPVFKNVGSSLESMGKIFKSVFDGIKNVVEKAYNFVKPLIDGIGNAVSGISGAVSSGLGWIANKIGKNATGTKYWRGGLSVVGEHGPELVQMPSGSKVYTNTETNSILNSYKQGRQSTNTGTTVDSSITIAKIADTIVVREESDIDKIANAIVSKLQQRRVAFGG